MSLLILPLGLDDIRTAIFHEAQADVPLLEDPLFSNRSVELDILCHRWGIPAGSYWCAAWAADVWKRAGAEYPPIDDAKGWHPAKAETWRQWAAATGRLYGAWGKVQIGDAVLYGPNGKAPADHIGAAVAGKISDKSGNTYLWDFEGNTSGDPTFSRNGELSTCKAVDPSRVIGFVSAVPLPLPETHL